MKFELEG